MKRVTLAVLSTLVLLMGCKSSGSMTPIDLKERTQCTSPPSLNGPDNPNLRLIAVGDAGLSPEDPESLLGPTLAGMKAIEDPDAILVLGDNVYGCGLRDANDPNWTAVIQPLFALGKPVYPVLGNHDWGSRALRGCGFSNPDAEIKKSGTPGFELWNFPAPNYVVNTEVAEIIFFDSSPIAEDWADAEQRSLCALRSALSASKTKPWRIVVAHHPLYSCGEHGAEQETVRMRDAVEDLLKDHGVDLYLSGHDHHLETRTTPSSPLFVVSGSGSKIRTEGATCEQDKSFRIVGGFMVLDITADTLKVRAYCNDSSSTCLEEKTLSRSVAMKQE